MDVFIKKRHTNNEKPKESWHFCRLKGLVGIDEDMAGEGKYLRWNGKYWDGVEYTETYTPEDIAYWLEMIKMDL